VFDRTGLCVWAKRLEQGKLISNCAHIATHEMDCAGLKLPRESIEQKHVRLRYKKSHSHSGNASIHAVLSM
jgi:transposase